jgi:hypothetical protein
VVERAVLHHQHDEVVDRHVARRGQRRGERLALGRLAEQEVQGQGGGDSRGAGGQGGAGEELAPLHAGLG